MKKTTVAQNGLIWFGAGVSLAEILTGTYFASLGMALGMAAILLGHVIGGAMMYLAGLIGGRTGLSAMETVKLSFGSRGGMLFAALNVLQLVGWTAIMIYDGALAVGGIFPVGAWVWCLVIGGLIILWIAVGITNLGWLNKVAMALLLLLTMVLCKVIFFSGAAPGAVEEEVMSFGDAVELAVAMPLSWLPLISDYTREAEKPAQATLCSVVVYGLVSCWMYVIGMGAALYTGESDIAQIMVKAGLGVAALVIPIVFTLRCAAAARSSFYTILSCATAAMLVCQMALNVLGAVDLLPLTGVTFPFVSMGGSSMISCWGLMAYLKAADTRQNASFALRLSKLAPQQQRKAAPPAKARPRSAQEGFFADRPDIPVDEIFGKEEDK